MSEEKKSGKCTLDEILAARDARHGKQVYLLNTYPGHALICITVVMPGEEKRNKFTKTIGEAAFEAVSDTFDGKIFLPDADARLLVPQLKETGYEAFILVSGSPTEAKEIAAEIEDRHPLGRLFDIDVIGTDYRPLSRQEIGKEPRKCLLCNNEARLCMRLHSHTHEQLLRKIGEIVASWQKDNLHP